MYKNVTQEFVAAIDSSSIHKIRGTILCTDGTAIDITSLIIGSPEIYSQCVCKSESFNFGGIYVGEASLLLNIDYSLRGKIIGGKLTLDFGLDGFDGVWVPLGVWYVSSAKRSSGGKISITAVDCMKKLVCETDERHKNFIGFVGISDRIGYISKTTGINFAQSAAEISAMSSITEVPYCYGVSYSKTLWDEVAAIAQWIGGFAFSNREGKIEFRRYGTEPVITIPADRRKSVLLEEYSYKVGGVKYTDSKGYSVISELSQNRDVILTFQDNAQITEWDGSGKEAAYKSILDSILQNLKDIEFTPGTVEYSGNPLLDVGDLITLTGGIAQSSSNIKFLICCNNYKFRGFQTLTACGLAEGEYDGSSSNVISGSDSSDKIRYINASKSIELILCETHTQELSANNSTIADSEFSIKEDTVVCVDGIATVLCDNIADAEIIIKADETEKISYKQTLYAGYNTVPLKLLYKFSPGNHTIDCEMSGIGSVNKITASVWGQGLQEISTEPTASSDYLYRTDSVGVHIYGYIGSIIRPEIPDTIDSKPVVTIESTAFNYNNKIKAVVIPEGVTAVY